MRGENNTGAQPDLGRYYGQRLSLAVIIAMGATAADAGEWRFQPYIDVAEIYTDNVTLAPEGKEEDELITEISPGFVLNGHGGRGKADISYRLQNLLYLNDSTRNSSNHQLSATGNVELARELFFVDAHSSISQQIIDPRVSVPLDNINVGNRANVVTYGVSPYLRFHLGSYAEGQLRYGIDRVSTDSDITSDAETNSYSAQLSSGRSFSRFTWGMNFSKQDMQRDSAPDSHRESSSAAARYRLLRTLNLLARGGYEQNEVTASEHFQNGGYWSAGAEWIPNRQLTVSATTGENNRDADIFWQPTIRSHFHVGYQDRSVGLTPGSRWTGDISHYSRRSSWNLSYTEEVTNTQFLQLSGRQFFVLVDAEGKLAVDPSTGLPVILVNNVFTLTNEEFLRKRFQGTVNWNVVKNQFMLSTFNETRVYQISNASEEVVGANALWTLRFKPRTQSLLAGGWEHRNPVNTGVSDDLWYTSWALAHTFSQKTSANLEFRHTTRDGGVTNGDYQENRVTLQLSKRF